jgi:hypothetical protein
MGSVCIDRQGFHWKGPAERPGEGQSEAASSRDSALWAGRDPADEWRRGSRNYLEAKRGQREVCVCVAPLLLLF